MTCKPIEDVLAAIDRLDLEPIRRRLTHEHAGKGWSEARAVAAERDYRRYLKLLAKYPEETLAPTPDIDEFWHAHILDTRKYAADCAQAFGEFVHHYPYLGLGDETDRAAQQQAADALHALYEREFGEPIRAAAESSFCARSQPAFCARTPEDAFCARQAAPQEAFCARRPEQTAAFCARQPQDEAAFCARRPQVQASFCARNPQDEAAFCARQPAGETSLPGDGRAATGHPVAPRAS